MEKIVIIPTYNEKENIEAIIDAVISLNQQYHILIIDDGSPDGTASIVKSLFPKYPGQLFMEERKGKLGLGTAYIHGFKWALKKGYRFIFEMDADFSHRPLDLVKILNELDSSPVVVGSRYVDGGATVNWGIGRKIISQGGSLYSRLILGYPVRDWTGGFNGWHTKVLTDIGLDQIRSNGYSFQIELKYKAQKKGYTVKEVPIVFEDRRVGQSKMSTSIVLEAFYKVWMIRE